MAQAPDYLNPNLPENLTRTVAPVVKATHESLEGYGVLVNDPEAQAIEIVRWPATGTRPVDPDSGDEGGTVEGEFTATWRGDVLYGQNAAVGGHYVLGYAADPASASEAPQAESPTDPQQILLWHANYHPDGGQLFFPLDRRPFLVPLAKPGDDISPEDFVCFRFDGTRGLYIHPGVWHEGVFPVAGRQRFFDRQHEGPPDGRSFVSASGPMSTSEF